ncbi:hypothetical protein ACD591_07165 [Rufibacter glacialis]|uniref:Dam-replacing protein HTH domain-containing protein n=1 Tax=Rufibacter glacialis TaxID=1259555 RepID=A0A5M8QE21_9BACT|nr:hypothetical protein [Rufibacter glacialis]KAA6433428.1 hypothetical protein FOE74_13215 [Rufibacter glacialis]GGK74290.1 hypothetical protein GCM10011405_22940 [Rufibacter glacialis]
MQDPGGLLILKPGFLKVFGKITQERPATAQDLYQQFKPVAKPQQPQRLQQIDNLLQTLHGLGLLRKTGQEQYVK